MSSVKARVADLNKGDLSDKITAIIMDLDIGGTGLHEPLAREKALHIMSLLQKKHSALENFHLDWTVHGVARSGHGDVETQCGLFMEASWVKDQLPRPPAGAYWGDKDFGHGLYTFGDVAVTCEACRKEVDHG